VNPAGGKAKILMVDDEPKNLLAIEAILDNLGLDLVKAHSGKEALRCLIKDDFAVILLDVQMPEMDGFECATLIRSRDKNRYMPIIFLTAVGRTEAEMFRGFEVGAMDYLLKPLVPTILRSKVKIIIELYQKTEQVLRLNLELQDANAGLEARVRERTAALVVHGEDLARTNGQLLSATRAKSEFLANMSHELRTPLNSVIGFSEVLSDLTFGPLTDKQKTYVGNILTSGKHLLSLINQLLDMSRIEAGKMRLQLSTVDPRCLFLDISALMADMVAKKRLTMALEIDQDLPSVEWDELKIKEIIYNLLSNAVKFTPAGGAIGMRARREGAVLKVEVWDSGIGIAAESMKNLFDGFFRVDGPYNRLTEGTGLGLPLSRKLTELHGGTLGVESEGLNKGTRVRITLPLAANPGP
jgi:signal transduction histidine kinase